VPFRSMMAATEGQGESFHFSTSADHAKPIFPVQLTGQNSSSRATSASMTSAVCVTGARSAFCQPAARLGDTNQRMAEREESTRGRGRMMGGGRNGARQTWRESSR